MGKEEEFFTQSCYLFFFVHITCAFSHFLTDFFFLSSSLCMVPVLKTLLKLQLHGRCLILGTMLMALLSYAPLTALMYALDTSGLQVCLKDKQTKIIKGLIPYSQSLITFIRYSQSLITFIPYSQSLITFIGFF